MKNKVHTSKKPYKNKALKAALDLESKCDGDINTTNVCFMAQDNDPHKIILESFLDDSDLFIGELSDDFEQFLIIMIYLNWRI